MDFARALTFVTEDERWKEKVAIGTGVVILSTMLSVILIGLLGFLIVMGYSVRLMQNVRDGKQKPLPEWDDWGGDLTRGFKLFIVFLVWALPIVLLMMPSIFGAIMLDAGSDRDGRGFLAAIGGMTMGLGYCLMFLYGLFLVALTPAINIWFARDEQVGSGLRFTEIWNWTRNHLGEVVIFTLAYLIASFLFSVVASIVGVILCVVGLFVTVPLATLVTYIYQYNLLGQIAFKDRTGQPYYTPSTPVVPAGAAYQPAPAAPAAPAPEAPPMTPPAEPPVAPETPSAPETPATPAAGEGGTPDEPAVPQA